MRSVNAASATEPQHDPLPVREPVVAPVDENQGALFCLRLRPRRSSIAPPGDAGGCAWRVSSSIAIANTTPRL